MNNEINLIELFSGIGGFSKGLEDAGFKINKHYFSEIEPHAIANYKYNFPNAEYIGSVTDISGRNFRGINAITFGSPCQDFSIAGKGEGMDGKRSVLILEAIRLVTEIRPDFFIWENVKGAFSSNAGADFWAIIQAFANIGGYRLEWQLLNTNWFLPQNRERIYLVGHLAESKRSFGKVFPIRENDKMALFPFGKKTESGSWIQVQPDRIAAALNQRMSKMGIDDNYIKIRSNTKDGYEYAKSGDGIRFDHLVENTTGRGRVKKNSSHTLDCSATSGVLIKEGIRQFTEIECERLQGFPDDWTKYGIYENKVWINKNEGTFKIVEGKHIIPKTQRYKMLGNAVSTPTVKEIAKRLIQN